jgi:hypothetical protein
VHKLLKLMVMVFNGAIDIVLAYGNGRTCKKYSLAEAATELLARGVRKNSNSPLRGMHGQGVSRLSNLNLPRACGL